MHWVYVLKSGRERWIYVGRTKNLTRRLSLHRKGWIRSTRGKRPLEVVYFERHKLGRNAKARAKLLRATEYGKLWIDEVVLQRNWRSVEKLRTSQPSFFTGA